MFEKWQSETEPCSGNHLVFLHFVMEMGDISQTVTLSSHPFPLDYLDPSELNPFVIPSLFFLLLFVPSQTRSLQTPVVLNYANCVRGSATFGGAPVLGAPRLIPSNYRSKELDVICALAYSTCQLRTAAHFINSGLDARRLMPKLHPGRIDPRVGPRRSWTNKQGGGKTSTRGTIYAS